MKKERSTTYNTFAVLFYINRQKVKKNGLCPLMGRISINTEVAQFSTKMEVQPELWDAKKYRLTGKSRIAKEVNVKIDRLEEEIYRHYREILDEQGYITAELVKNAVNGVGQYKRKLLELYREYMEEYAKRVGINRAYGTLKAHKASYKTLQKFIHDCYGAEDIPLKQLDYAFIEKYDSFLRTDMGYSIATVEGYIIKLKTMTRTALAQGTIRYNPFASFIPEKALRKHRHLTMDELQKLMHTPVPNGFLCLVRDMFIFSTFTGISYIDMCNLNTSNLSKDSKGNLWIKLKRQKTKSECAIRLLDIPRRILEKYEGERTGDRLFNMPCRSALTNNMPKLAKLCGIERRLTYHMARHNFGTLITLSQGVPLETVCQMMGHKNMRTTQIYSRLTHQKVDEDVKKLTQRIGNKFRMPEWNKDRENIKNIHYGTRNHYNQ
ncbi:site-specific integrase [Paraprevotella clara]|jgi:site-specific recombinase XerD|uniref:site-specific integrase n=1 Tax=Paraprevotella clara TaxID=454154 RepID=UPI0026DD37AD|nr:site-specific integrase [Paraprevotella clara]